MKKLKYELDKEEQEILDSYERGEWKPVKNQKQEKLKAQQIARNTLNRNARINIRMRLMDLNRIKAIAEEEGLPYQTLIASVLHKFAEGRLKSV